MKELFVHLNQKFIKVRTMCSDKLYHQMLDVHVYKKVELQPIVRCTENSSN